MPRTLSILIPKERTEEIVEALREHAGLLSLQYQPSASLQPPGSVVTATVTSRSVHGIVGDLQQRGVGTDSSSSVLVSDPTAVIAAPHARAVVDDASGSTWEEMDARLAKEGNMTMHGIAAMAAAGALAAIGLQVGALHLVIGGMLIAPGFEPLARFALAVVAGARSWRVALLAGVKAYGALLVGAIAMTFVFRIFGKSIGGSPDAYVDPHALIAYWTGIRFVPIFVAIVGTIAGTVLIAANRTLLTAGVMATLSLVPALAIVGIGIARGDGAMLLAGLWRWLFDVGVVIGVSFILFGIERWRVHRRRSLM